MRRLSYLFPAFPVLHQTFTLGEVLGLKRRGYDLVLISLKGSSVDLQQPEAKPLLAETHYCPRLLSGAVLGAVWRAVRARPRDVAGLFRDVVAAWRTRAPRESDSDGPPPTTLSFGERVLAVYHHNPWVYLAKSLVLVPYAIYVAEQLQRRVVGHVHAHWATYPTTVAYLVKRWCGTVGASIGQQRRAPSLSRASARFGLSGNSDAVCPSSPMPRTSTSIGGSSASRRSACSAAASRLALAL